jgi:crossover junction endodeoxyribonuclease RuvC
LRAVGFDPGLATTGFAAVERGRTGVSVLGTGLLRTQPAEPLGARLEQLFDGVHGVLDSFAPDLLVIEDLFSAPAVPRPAILMAHARAVIFLVARQRKVAAVSVTPAEVKRAVTASGVAGKDQVARAVQAHFGLAVLPRPSHVADALALAFIGLSRAGGVGSLGMR